MTGVQTCALPILLDEKSLSYSQLQSQYKDWNEDIKAVKSIVAIPAEEHPQHLLKKQLCEEILMLINETELIDLQFEDCEKALLQAQKQNENQADAMKLTSALFLCLALKQHRQIGTEMTAEEIVQSLSEQFRAYQNRSKWDPTLPEARRKFSNVENAKVQNANVFQEVAFELLRSLIKLEFTLQKQIQTTSLKMS